jgi:hypothetical protein
MPKGPGQMWPGRGADVARSWSRCGQVVEQMWPGRGADVARSWSRCGQVVEQMWPGRGADVARSWSRCGQVVEQMWPGRGADVARSWRRCGQVRRRRAFRIMCGLRGMGLQVAAQRRRRRALTCTGQGPWRRGKTSRPSACRGRGCAAAAHAAALSCGGKEYVCVLPSTAEYCRALQSTAEHCRVLPSTAEYCRVLPSTAEHPSDARQHTLGCETRVSMKGMHLISMMPWYSPVQSEKARNYRAPLKRHVCMYACRYAHSYLRKSDCRYVLHVGKYVLMQASICTCVCT